MNVFELIDQGSKEAGEPIAIRVRRAVDSFASGKHWEVVITTGNTAEGPPLQYVNLVADNGHFAYLLEWKIRQVAYFIRQARREGWTSHVAARQNNKKS